MPKITLHLSWKQKLIVVTVITLLGLLTVAGSAFTGLNTVNGSFSQQTAALEYKQDALSLTIKLLRLESSVSTLTKTGIGNLTEDLDSFYQMAVDMQSKASGLNNDKLVDYADQLGELTDSYISRRKEWLDNRLILGFSSTEGQLAQLATALAALEKISFTMIEGPINDIVSNQPKYITNRDEGSQQKLDDAISSLEADVVKNQWQDIVIGKTVKAYRDAFDSVRILVVKEVDIQAALIPVTQKLNEIVVEKSAFLEASVVQQVASEASNAGKAAMMIIGMSGMIVGIVIFVSLSSVARQLNIQLKNMQDFLKKVADGNFSELLAVNNNQKDEFTQLRLASNHMVRGISEVISKVVDGNDALLNTRQQLEEAVEQLSITSKEVEQKTQQSTVATQQISTVVSGVAKRSASVNDTVRSASQATDTGRKVVNDCVGSMVSIVKLIENTNKEVSNLSQSSTQMLGIIDIINGLADQTNLLALNAAIESARAGEAGRGFSVVADEVRALAKKTVSATSSINSIIKNFNQQTHTMSNLMEDGIKLASSGQDNANNAVSSFETIDGQIQEVAAEMDQVVVAVDEILHNAEDIAVQVEHICQQGETTRHTRQSLEEHTEHLSEQAETLGVLTSRFRLLDQL